MDDTILAPILDVAELRAMRAARRNSGTQVNTRAA